MKGGIALLTVALLLAPPSARAEHKLSARDIQAPIPLPRGSLLIIGFLGAWEDWDNSNRSVRKVALSLRDRKMPGVYVETAGNHQRRVVLRYIRQALDSDHDGKLSPQEKRNVGIILYGQSFGGAAVVTLARELERQGIPVRLTIQIDSVGKSDAKIPANVARALNLYQHDPGSIWGRDTIEAVDPSSTAILGNIRFTYLFRDIDMSNYPKMARKIPMAHWKMDNDPVVWKTVETTILAEVAELLPAIAPSKP